MSRDGPVAGVTSIGESGTAAGGTDPRRALVVGGGHVGRLLADRLAADYDVTFVATAPEAAERAGVSDARYVREITAGTLERIGADEAAVAIVASRADGSNLLAAQLLRTRFGVEDVVMLVNDPDRADSLGTLDVEVICVSDLLATGVSDHLQRLANE